MPELAEVYFYAKTWEPGVGAPIVRVHTHPGKRVYRDQGSDVSFASLKGRRLAGWETHGKQMLFRFNDDRWLTVHLGMTGELSVKPVDWKPEKHDHLVLFQKKQALVFRDPRMFGRLLLEKGKAVPSRWRSLPPAILSKDFSKAFLQKGLKRRRRSPIKAVLLLQDLFPGIGNWMADELLWRCGFHPERAAGSLTSLEQAALWKATRQLTRQSLKVIGEDWSDPPRSWLFLHRWKAGGQCPRSGCGEKLARGEVGGRTTCWCPQCQKLAGQS